MRNHISEFQNQQDKITMGNVLNMFSTGDEISISLIQRKCKAGYFSAYRVFEQLKEEGRIRPGKGANGISKFI
jgi:hypothetical protein